MRLREGTAQATDAGISKVEDRELDGVPAKTYVAADEFEAQEATLDRTLATWRWTGPA